MKASLFAWLFVILLPWIWLAPAVERNSFGMVDDAMDIRLFRAMEADFSAWWNTTGLYGEIENGRFRTVYWLCRYLFQYLPFHLEPRLWMIAPILILTLILTSAFTVLKSLTGKTYAAFIGCALWVINPKTAENFVRLAPAETWQLLWIASGMAILLLRQQTASLKIKKMLLVPLGILLLFAYFTKETTVVLLPFSLCMLFFSMFSSQKETKQTWIWFSIWTLVFFILQRALAPSMQGYSSSFGGSFQVILDNLGRYPGRVQWGLAFLVLAGSYIGRIYVRWRQASSRFPDLTFTERWQFGLLTLGILFFAILLPWSQPEGRYLIMTDFFFALFMGIEIFACYEFFKQSAPGQAVQRHKNQKKIIFSALLCILCFFSQAGFTWEIRYLYAQRAKEPPVEALKKFSLFAKPNAKVLYLEFENEILEATSFYLSDLFGRKDIKLYSFSPFAPNLQAKGLAITALTQNQWPAILDEVDYIYWQRRGILRAWIDQFNIQLLQGLMNSEYKAALRPIYQNIVNLPPHRFPEGTQIWSLEHDQMNQIRTSKTQKESAHQ